MEFVKKILFNKNFLLSLTVLFIGIFAGVLFGEIYDPNNIILGRNVNYTEQRVGGYKFINPLLECDQTAVSSQINGLNPLNDKIENKISDWKQNSTVTDAAAYFRDLNSGPWFGVDEHANFAPASLLKLPVLIAYFKKADSDPAILQKTLEFKGLQYPLTQNFEKSKLIKG